MTYAVLTVCRNAEETIQQTIESVLCQSPPPGRYVFVDGNSGDRTLEIVEQNRREAEARGIEYRVLKQERAAPGAAGIPSAWNQGLRTLDSEVVFILNADDWYEPGAARTVLEAFEACPDAGIVLCPVALKAGPGRPARRMLRPRSLRWLPVLMPVPHPGCFVRREVYDAIGLYDQRYCISADYDFIFRCRREHVRFEVLKNALVNMRLGGRASRQKKVARKETRDIALKYSRFPFLPRLACAMRTCLGR